MSNLSMQLKHAHRAIKKQLESSSASAWVRDNFYIIDNSFREAISSRPYLNQERAYILVKRYLSERDYIASPETLKSFLLSQEAELGYYELCSLKALIIACAVITIAQSTLNGQREYLIPNAVKTLIGLSNPDYDEILPSLWAPERILAKSEEDYDLFDKATKQQYRASIARQARLRGISESKAVLRLVERANQQSIPIGSILFKPNRLNAVLFFVIALAVFSALLAAAAYTVGWISIFLLVPLGVCAAAVSEQIISLFVPAYRAPRLELDEVPDNAKTLVAVASLMTKGENGVFESLSRFRCSNPDKNIYFCLLADFPDSDNPYRIDDNEIIESARRKIDELNRLYGGGFCLFFRERVLNESEGRYGGWERKRGAVCELISQIVYGGRSEYYGNDFIRDIKYLVTLDSDTNLSVGSVRDMLSVALHPVNRLKIKDNRAVSGYGVIQPAVYTELKSGYRTGFSRLVSGSGGADSYANASFQRNQALFGLGSFCGKGLIDVHGFDSIVNGAIPEGLVLSHDVIEGGLLRTLSVGDIALTDSTPANTVSFFKRQHRWMRGDFQNLYFLFTDRLGVFTRLSLALTAIKHLSPIFSLLAVVCAAFMREGSGFAVLLFATSEYIFPCAFTLIRFFVHGKPFACLRFFSKAYTLLTQTAIRVFFEISSGCRRAFLALHALTLALIRLYTRRHTLEWTTAAQTERLSSSLGKYALDGVSSFVLGFALLALAKPPFIRLLGLFYFIYPFVSYIISRSVGGGEIAQATLTERQRKQLLTHANDMLSFYLDNVNEGTNHLPPDNIQLSPVEATAMRTSPTNIGFYLVSLLAARDIGRLCSSELALRLDNSLSVIESLDKYSGNLYNWYDLKSLSVIGEGYVSTVDSGNFLVMLTALKQGLYDYKDEDERILPLIERIEVLLEGTDLLPLYDKKRSLFRIGVSGDGNMDNNCYDMLMSEARMTAYYAVATAAVPKKHWSALGRTLTHKHGYIGMLSWSGTAFEYLMPHLFLPLYRDSFMYESVAFSLMIQRTGREIWGISESGYYSFDSSMNYQYKANGIQALALRRISGDENIVSPYSTYLSLCLLGGGAIKNLQALENRGMYGRYGLYEAIDFNRDSGGICVKSYMAHHVGMSIIAIMNAVNQNIFVKRFMADARMTACYELLQEKIPIDAHIFDDDRALAANEIKAPRISNRRETLTEPSALLLKRGDTSAIITSMGHIGLQCGDRWLSHTQYSQGLRFNPIIVFSRMGESYGCSQLYGESKYSFERGTSYASHIVSSKEFSGRVRYSMAKNANCFIISTRAEALRKYDITLAFEPVLENGKKYLSHISFSRLFIESEYDKQKRILYFHRRSGLDGRRVFSIAVAPRDRDMEFGFLTSRERLRASSVMGFRDYALAEVDNAYGTCIDPICLVRSCFADGGRATFLISCGETKGECERNIRIARRDKGEFPLPKQDALFSRMLTALLYGNALFVSEGALKSSINDLWSRGISGDYPLCVAEVSEIAKSRTDAVLKSFLQLSRARCIFELVFIVQDGDKYNRPVEREIRKACEENKLSSFIGARGGIFILRKGEAETSLLAALKSCARCFLDFSASELKPKITNIEPPCTVEAVCTRTPLALPDGAVKSNGGYFLRDCFVVDKSSLPLAPYSYILTGRRFSSVVTQSSLGYTFFDNARERRLCSFYGDAKTLDNGERIFARYGDKYYDLCAVSNKVVYGNGVAEYRGSVEGSEFRLSVFVCEKFPIKLIKVCFFGTPPKETVFSVNPVMGGDSSSVNRMEGFYFKASSNACIGFKNTFGITFPEGYGFAGVCSGRADAARGMLFSQGAEGLFFLGACTTEGGIREVARRIDNAFYEREREKAVAFAGSMLPKIEISTKSELQNLMLNSFLPYQVAACRFYARGSFYQSGGAYGFRDQLQDCLTLIYSSPSAVRTHIIRCCAHQYTDGSVMHWWHTRNQGGVNSGIKSKCSDDLLYLPLVVSDYLEKTKDFSLLGIGVYYLTSAALGKENERYEIPTRSDVRESVYEHCLRALSHADKRGRHGLILMGSCDWNDAFSLVGAKGIGESVFSTLLYIVAIEGFLPIIEQNGDSETASHYRKTVTELRQAVEETAFFEDRYARAFCDDGTVLGVSGCAECEIDILSQAFAALAGLNKERTRLALKTAFSKLYDRKNRILKLFSPPFTNQRTKVGYIRGYVAGIRENGGQYTHGALWGALGCLRVGLYEEALLILDCANPATRSADKELAKRYKTEPYAIAADIYSGEHSGRGGWSWYTGAASWYYRITLENLLGIKLGAEQTINEINPVIAYEARITHGSAVVRIKADREVKAPMLNGIQAEFPLKLPSGESELKVPITEYSE